MRFLLVLPLGLTIACAAEEGVDADGLDVPVTQKVYGGSAITETYQEATVSLHTVSTRGTVSRNPFCSGTLIDSQWVLTAGHCVSSGSRVTSASRLAVYIGDDPSADLSSHTYLVDQVRRHSSYSRTTLLNDVAVLHLTSAVTEASPVPPLPAASPYGLTSADVGTNLNFVGFGYDETGSYGDRLQVDVPLGGLGCSVSGCPGGYNTATWQAAAISYKQNGATSSAADDTGPCSGDSGGPAFLDDGTDQWVVGITSWGDSACRSYGVSTRVDTYESFIEGYTGDLNGA